MIYCYDLTSLTSDPLSAYPSLWHLCELDVDDIWFNLGLQFGLHEDELTAIEKKSKHTNECKVSLFHTLKLKIPEFQVCHLLKAFRNGNVLCELSVKDIYDHFSFICSF